MKVLVLENTLPFGKAIQEVLEDDQCHQVVIAQGMVDDLDQQVVAKTHDGRNVPLDVDEIDLVLVDGNAPKELASSESVVKRFCKHVPCVAISALPGMNKVLVDAGAKLQVRKHVLICGMAAGCMKMAELALASPVVQARLESLDQRVSRDKALRKQGEDVMARHLQAA